MTRPAHAGRHLPQRTAAEIRKAGPLDTWLAVRKPITATYPCRCHRAGSRDCGSTWCPCWGRTDTTKLPELCCGRPTDIDEETQP